MPLNSNVSRHTFPSAYCLPLMMNRLLLLVLFLALPLHAEPGRVTR